MKKLILSLGVLAMMSASAPVFADFNTDARDGAVTCRLTGGSGTVVINANRKAFKVTLSQGAGTPPLVTRYIVDKRDSDGDTYVEYDAKKPAYAILTFSDHGDGDTLELEGMVHPLTCPQ